VPPEKIREKAGCLVRIRFGQCDLSEHGSHIATPEFPIISPFPQQSNVGETES
jgi:hypothetical protein